jgi:hypothetical protein
MQLPWMIKQRKLEAGLLGKRLSQRCKIDIKENVFFKTCLQECSNQLLKFKENWSKLLQIGVLLRELNEDGNTFLENTFYALFCGDREYRPMPFVDMDLQKGDEKKRKI